jgi:hypothetical protein
MGAPAIRHAITDLLASEARWYSATEIFARVGHIVLADEAVRIARRQKFAELRCRARREGGEAAVASVELPRMLDPSSQTIESGRRLAVNRVLQSYDEYGWERRDEQVDGRRQRFYRLKEDGDAGTRTI